MPLSTGETILGGMVVTIAGAIVGKVLGSKNKVTDEQCKERHAACVTNLCLKLDNLEKAQTEMKSDIKELLKR